MTSEKGEAAAEGFSFWQPQRRKAKRAERSSADVQCGFRLECFIWQNLLIICKLIFGKVLSLGQINDIIKIFAQDGKRDLHKPEEVRKAILPFSVEGRLLPAFVIGIACSASATRWGMGFAVW